MSHVQLEGYVAKNPAIKALPTVCGLWVTSPAFLYNDSGCVLCAAVLAGTMVARVPPGAVREDDPALICVTHHDACACREHARAQRDREMRDAIARLLDELADQGVDTVEHPTRALLEAGGP